ncbi:MAG: xanthine dehydrogenase family protein molybdopterin-binding subunit, partial [Proteobacteria bacterium]
MNFHRARIGLDEKGRAISWQHEIAGQSIMAGGPMEAMIKEGKEPVVTEGVSETKYALPNFRVLQARVPSPITTLWWRSVGHTHTAFAMETLIDELAEAAKVDPMAFRKKLLAKEARHLAVLNLLQKESGWGTRKPPKGRAWGLAIHESFASVVGQVAEVSIENGRPRVHKVWAVGHIGQVVNPDGAKTQMEGGIGFGLSALHQGITFEAGQVVQQNFLEYPVLRINEMPEIKVAFVKSTANPTGLGEPGVPPILPAVANAYYQLTGKRIRKLPFAANA